MNETNKKYFKNDKMKIILCTLCSIIALTMLGYEVFFNDYLNPKNYIEEITTEINSSLKKFMNKTVQENNEVDKSLDSQFQGNLNLHKEGENLFAITYDIKNSSQKSISSIDTEIKSCDRKIIDANLFFQDNNIYFYSKEIFKKLLKIDYTFENTSNTNEYIILTSAEDFAYYTMKMVEYHLTSLKEADLSVKLKGIKEKEYHLKLDAKTKMRANQKLEELIEQDEKLKDILNKYNVEKYSYLQTGEIIFTVSLLKNELKAINISTSDIDLEVICDEEKYTIYIDDQKYFIWLKENTFKLEQYEKDALTNSIEMSNENGYEITYLKDNDTFTFSSDHIDEETTEYNINLFSPNNFLETKLKASKQIKDQKDMIIKGEGAISLASKTIDFNFEINAMYKEGIIERIDPKNAKDIEKLTPEEQEELINNINSLVKKIGILDDYTY